MIAYIVVYGHRHNHSGEAERQTFSHLLPVLPSLFG